MSSQRIFIDTNPFIRFLTNDIPEQAEAVENLLQRAAGGECALVTNSMVVAEIVWTLASFYHLPKTEIKDKVLAIVNTPGLEIPEDDLVIQAITWYTEKNVDFADAFNAAWLLNEGITTACTFDRKHYARFEGVTVLTPEKGKPV
jgi:predicted nucleic-acid-binding protein